MRIAYRNVTLRDGRTTIIEHVDQVIEPESITGFYGARDSAKTALMLAAAGLFQIASGTIVLGDITVNTSPKQARKLIGLAASPTVNPLLSHLSVEDNMHVQARSLHVFHAKQAIDELLQRFQLSSIRKEDVDNLSEFMIAKVGLAMALLGNPPCIFVDEPERRLMTEETDAIMDSLLALKQEGKTVLITTCRRELLTHCDRFITIPYKDQGVTQHESIATNLSGTQTTSAGSI